MESGAATTAAAAAAARAGPAAGPINPFRSERLVYRAAEDSAEDEAFVHRVQRDAEAQSGASYGLLLPESRAASRKFRRYVAEDCLLGVIVCLPAEGRGAGGRQKGQGGGEEEEEEGEGEEEEEKEEEGQVEAGEPVGILCLKGAGGANTGSGTGHHRATEVSVDVARAHRGRGIGGEAVRWGLWYAFEMAGLHRVQIEALGFNEGAARLYRRLGFAEEGALRQAVWFNGRWHDRLVFGMLEDEWRARYYGGAA